MRLHQAGRGYRGSLQWITVGYRVRWQVDWLAAHWDVALEHGRRLETVSAGGAIACTWAVQHECGGRSVRVPEMKSIDEGEATCCV